MFWEEGAIGQKKILVFCKCFRYNQMYIVKPLDLWLTTETGLLCLKIREQLATV